MSFKTSMAPLCSGTTLSTKNLSASREIFLLMVTGVTSEILIGRYCDRYKLCGASYDLTTLSNSTMSLRFTRPDITINTSRFIM